MSSGRITLRPVTRDGRIETVLVRMDLDGTVLPEGREVCYAQLETVSVPGAVPEDLHITDAEGPVPFTERDEKVYPILFRHYEAGRDIRGHLTISYRVTTCERLAEGRHGPYFQMARELDGFSSPGIAFLNGVPGFEGSVDLVWDLTEAESGQRGVCTWGENDVDGISSLEELRQCYFMFGQVHSVGSGDFGFYWLTQPPFDVSAMADYTRKLFGIMQKFFRDTGSVYRIFMRHDLTVSSGGTALVRSYMFGWNDHEQLSLRDKQNLLAHEMVHNWPSLNDVPYGITTWYAEGTAEYYSIMIPLRAGLITPQEALGEIQKRTDAYYTNPTRHLGNMEAAGVAWKDRRAQRLSYGRGFFFLALTDAEIRRRTHGSKSLDDVVLDILDKGRAGVTLGNEVFLESVQALGVDVRDKWEIMQSGGHFAPDPDSFDGLFDVKEVPAEEADTGNAAVSYQWTLR